MRVSSKLLPAFGFVLFGHAAVAAEKPSVLFIAVDDLRDWVGHLHTHPQVRTPNLDALARRGMVFERAYTAAPECSPSRTALLTGLSPDTTGVYRNGDQWPEPILHRTTLTRTFMDNGYFVAGAGKIYHSQGKVQNWHAHNLIDDNGGRSTSHPTQALGHALDVADEATFDGQRTTWAIQRLDEKPAAPIFLALGLVRPHQPWDVPRKYFDMYPLDSIQLPEVKPDDLDDVPAAGQAIAGTPLHNIYVPGRPEFTHEAIVEKDLWKLNVQAYLASITFADAQIGRMLKAWDRSPYARNGIIVVWGDHGYHLGEKNHWSKVTLWEAGTRTPLLFAGPGIKAGARCKVPVSLLDLFPTLLDLAGLPPRHDLDGVSLVPLVKRPGLTWDRPAVTLWGKGNYGVRSMRHRLIRYHDKTYELYDHDKDPNEWHNLADDPGSRLVRDELERWIGRHRRHPLHGLAAP